MWWLAVDSGNTRVKWAQMHGARVHAQGAAPKGKFAPPRLPAAAAAPAVRGVWVSHTGNAADWRQLEKKLAGSAPLHIVRPRRLACGVHNPYRPPHKLGADRWLCLLAARQLPVAQRRGAVVVSAGTALTIDILRSDGHFAGGWILPGLAAMTAALARHTPLPRIAVQASAKSTHPPRDTKDAIAQGATLAAAAAVRQARRQHLPGACMVLTGGDAALLAPHLPRARHLPELIFLGMAQLRASEGKGRHRA